MLDVDEEIAPPPAASKRKQLRSNAMKRISEWFPASSPHPLLKFSSMRFIFHMGFFLMKLRSTFSPLDFCRILSREISSDLTVLVGDATFSLHKFPLLSKCGYIKKLISESNNSNSTLIQISDIPGGAEAFELAAKFCYGINFEISVENIAMLRCAAEYLGMTEDYAVGNFVSKTEAYFEEVALISLSGAVTVLQKSEDLYPMSEKVKLVSRCIDVIAYLGCKDNQFYGSTRTDIGSSQESFSSSSNSQPRAIVDWWAEELMILRIDTFQRVLVAMEARGIKQHAFRPIIMLYAQKSLRGLDIFGRGSKKNDPKQEHEKRVVMETIVGLLPRERNAMSVSFLSMLLRVALYLETAVACRLDLEKRISLQLEQAVLDDLLIPSFSYNGDSIFDVDTVQRILTNYLDNEVDGNHSDDEYVSMPPSSVERVGKLMENYLAEIASDQNLTITSFISIAELVPEQAKLNEDGMYRAIDIYLKAHSSLSDMERKRVCSLMDCQKLSREACAHAAQNDRLPVQIVVQVLYYEQQRLRDSTNLNFIGGDASGLSHKSCNIGYNNQLDELSHLRRENDDLKLELVKTRMQLKELQKPSGNSTPSHADKPPLPKKSIMNSVSKKLGRLNHFVHVDAIKPFSSKARTKPPKNQRHSIS